MLTRDILSLSLFLIEIYIPRGEDEEEEEKTAAATRTYVGT